MRHEINVPKGCKVVSVETTDDMVVLKFEKEEPEFNENDILVIDSHNVIMIFEGLDDDGKIHTKCYYSGIINKLFAKSLGISGKMRRAIDNEKQLLFDKLKEKCLMFNGENVVRWRGELGDTYCYIDGDNTVAFEEEDDFVADDRRYNSGNYFPTREMAEAFQKQHIELLNNFHKNLQ